MNRRDRRRQQKTGGGGPAAPVPRRGVSVSDMLLGLGGIRPQVAAAPVTAEMTADPVHAALTQIRLNDGLTTELGRQELALQQHPDSEPLLYSVARLQLRLERRADALLTFRRLLALNPGHAEAAHMVAVLSGAVPEKADAAYVARLFDDFADSFDEKLTQWLDYKAPQHVAEAARRALAGRRARHAIDLGCGTGLLGPEVRDLAGHLDGIDLSPRMIEKARQRRLYDTLAVEEIIAWLAARPQGYDLALAADVLSYFGDLKPLFGALHHSLQAGGIFVATVEKGSGARYQAAKTGRYQHGEAYLRRRISDAGFELLAFDEIELRKEENSPVHGYVFALRRLADATPPDAVSELSQGALVAVLDQAGAGVVLSAAQQAISGGLPVGWAVDLGGGMARHAAALRDLTQHLDMVSADAQRSRQAFEAGLYDDCDSAKDVIAFLETRPDHYDLIMAADPQFSGADPALLFSAVKIALALAGVFIAVLPAGMHDAATLQEMAKAEGLIVLAIEPVTLSDGSAAFCLVAES